MQAEGVSFSVEDKLLVAQKLDEFGIHYIEGGFPQSNPKEVEFFHRIKDMSFENAKVVAFGSTRRANTKVEDDAAVNVLVDSGAPAVTMVGKTWDLHVTDVIRCSLEENFAMCRDSVAYVKKKGRDVIFDAEHFFDGYKNNPEFAIKVLQVAAEAGADALVLCETNGGCLPHEVQEITEAVCKAIPGIEIGIHCHNDTDCAVANSLASVRGGATHVQGTINGLGERTGNANLCTILPNLSLKMGYETVGEEKLKTLTELSRFVFEIANMAPAMHMPFVGESAFAHKAGLHIDA
ncbi:MAG: citramalate synthase, partial [Planctomycetota bacterium]